MIIGMCRTTRVTRLKGGGRSATLDSLFMLLVISGAARLLDHEPELALVMVLDINNLSSRFPGTFPGFRNLGNLDDDDREHPSQDNTRALIIGISMRLLSKSTSIPSTTKSRIVQYCRLEQFYGKKIISNEVQVLKFRAILFLDQKASKASKENMGLSLLSS